MEFDYSICLSDFGTALKMGDKTIYKKHTQYYKSPKILLSLIYSNELNNSVILSILVIVNGLTMEIKYSLVMVILRFFYNTKRWTTILSD
jgi:hypothetical protein